MSCSKLYSQYLEWLLVRTRDFRTISVLKKKFSRLMRLNERTYLFFYIVNITLIYVVYYLFAIIMKRWFAKQRQIS